MGAIMKREHCMREPYKSTDDFYAAVGEVVRLLRSYGHETDAQTLDSMLHAAWTTGSELIGELMLHLEGMKKGLPNDVQKLKDDCVYFAKHHREILRLD